MDEQGCYVAEECSLKEIEEQQQLNDAACACMSRPPTPSPGGSRQQLAMDGSMFKCTTRHVCACLRAANNFGNVPHAKSPCKPHQHLTTKCRRGGTPHRAPPQPHGNRIKGTARTVTLLVVHRELTIISASFSHCGGTSTHQPSKANKRAQEERVGGYAWHTPAATESPLCRGMATSGQGKGCRGRFADS